MVVLQGVTVTFGRRRALNDLSLTVPAGGSLALWGPNGAGKSTALHAILGLVPFAGQIQVGGRDVRRLGVAARQIVGWVPQDMPPLDMSVGQAVGFVAQLRQVSIPSPQNYLSPFGLVDAVGQPMAALSGGQRQRLSLALALLGDPQVLLLDEPTASLDPAGRRDILSLLGRLRRQGKTLLLATHRPGDVARLADRVAVLADGRLQHIMPAARLVRGPQMPPARWLRKGGFKCAGE